MGFRNPGAGTGGPVGTPTATIDIGDAIQVGATGQYADAGHQHQFPAPGNGYAEDVAESAQDGSATTPARSDHTHGHTAEMHLPGGHADLSEFFAELAEFLDHSARHEPGGVDALEGYVQLPPSATTQFVTSGGDDNNDGKTLATAKATAKAAHDALPSSGGIVRFGIGTMASPTDLACEITKPVIFAGAGEYFTRLTGGVNGDYVFHKASTEIIGGIEFRDLTIDLESGTNRGAVRVQYTDKFSMRRCTVKNITQWGLCLGILGTESTIANTNSVIEDCTFDTNASTLEQVLIFNSRDVKVQNNHFKNIVSTGIGIGLYQRTDNVHILDNRFDGSGRGAYYSLSCDNTTFRGNDFHCGLGIQGAQLSDNGAYGTTKARGLNVAFNRFSCTSSTAVQIGAVHDWKIIGNDFYQGREIAIQIFGGNTGTPTLPLGGKIIGNDFIENNQVGTDGLGHPAIYMGGVSGSYDLQIIGNNFDDRQATITQQFPIVVDGITVNHITITGNSVKCDTVNARSLHLANGAALGNSVQIYGNVNWTDNGATNIWHRIHMSSSPNGVRLQQGAVGAFESPVLRKAGAPTDGDYAQTPADGTLAVNTLTNKLYCRIAGVWTQVTT